MVISDQIWPHPQPLGINYFSVQVEVPQGWLDLNDGLVYRVAADSFDSANQQFRRQQVISPFVGGKFTVNSVPDQVEETLAVWVNGVESIDLQDNIDNLINAMTQFHYQVRIDIDANRRVWNCEQADYTIGYSQVGMHNRVVKASFNLLRQPTVYRELLVGE